MTDLPGFTMFSKGPDGAICQTYNVQGRGQDIINGAYNMLDFTAKGRDEHSLPFRCIGSIYTTNTRRRRKSPAIRWW